MYFRSTSLPSTESTPVPPFPNPGPSGLKSKTTRPDRALQVEQVVEEHRLASPKARHTLAQKQPVAAETSAFGDDHPFSAAFGNLDLGGDGIGLVEGARRGASGHTGQLARIGEYRLP